MGHNLVVARGPLARRHTEAVIMAAFLNMLKGAPLTPIIGAGAVLGGSYMVQNYSLITVEGGHAAVVFNRLPPAMGGGMKAAPLPPGMHFIVPFIEKATDFETRARHKNFRSSTASRDLQQVNIDLRVLHEPDQYALPQIYQELGVDYDERVLPSIANEVLKAVVARYKADELIQRRGEVSAEIQDALRTRARRFHINLQDVYITHLAFGKEYTNAVEAKQVAQQEAERARFLVDRALQEKKSTVIRAEGEAIAAEKLGKSMRESPGFLQLRKIEAAREISSTIARSSNRVYLNADSLLMNLADTK